MGDGPILSVIHTVTIDTMLNLNTRQNLGLKYQAKFCEQSLIEVKSMCPPTAKAHLTQK